MYRVISLNIGVMKALARRCVCAGSSEPSLTIHAVYRGSCTRVHVLRAGGEEIKIRGGILTLDSVLSYDTKRIINQRYVIIGMNLFLLILSRCKRRRITHKLSKEGLYVKFLSDSPEFTHR